MFIHFSKHNRVSGHVYLPCFFKFVSEKKKKKAKVVARFLSGKYIGVQYDNYLFLERFSMANFLDETCLQGII